MAVAKVVPLTEDEGEDEPKWPEGRVVGHLAPAGEEWGKYNGTSTRIGWTTTRALIEYMRQRGRITRTEKESSAKKDAAPEEDGHASKAGETRSAEGITKPARAADDADTAASESHEDEKDAHASKTTGEQVIKAAPSPEDIVEEKRCEVLHTNKRAGKRTAGATRGEAMSDAQRRRVDREGIRTDTTDTRDSGGKRRAANSDARQASSSAASSESTDAANKRKQRETPQRKDDCTDAKTDDVTETRKLGGKITRNAKKAKSEAGSYDETKRNGPRKRKSPVIHMARGGGRPGPLRHLIALGPIALDAMSKGHDHEWRDGSRKRQRRDQDQNQIWDDGG